MAQSNNQAGLTQIGPLNWSSQVVNMNGLMITSQSKIIHVIGQNGIGKSTLLNCVLDWLIDAGIPTNFVHQDYRNTWLWWRSIGDNLQLAWSIAGNQGKFTDSSLYVEESSWLDPVLNRPISQINFDTHSGVETSGLSGGQLQRIVLLREILFKPDYLLLDEALSALDPQVLQGTISWLMKKQLEYEFNIISISHSPEILTLMPGDIQELTRVDGELQIQSKSNKS